MNIPYILDERPDTGLTNSKLGIWIFLASEVMLFGGLFSAYVFLRIAAPEGDFDYWGAKLSVPMATFNTLVLITSSVTMVMAWASLKLKDFEKYKIYLGVTILCALAFLVVKYLNTLENSTMVFIQLPVPLWVSILPLLDYMFSTLLVEWLFLHIFGALSVIKCIKKIQSFWQAELKLLDFIGILLT